MGLDPDFSVAVGTPGGNKAKYDIWVNGAIRGLDKDTAVEDGYHAHGLVNGGWDRYEVRGFLNDFHIQTPPGARVQVNGEDVSRQAALEYRPERFVDENSRGSGGENPAPVPSNPPDIRDPPDGAPSATGINPIAKDEAIGGGAWHGITDANQEPEFGNVARYEQTVEDATLLVDENDAGALQDAYNRLPKQINHRVNVVLTDGKHTGNGSAVHSGYIVLKPTGRLEVKSRSRDRGRCVSASGVNGVFGGKQEHNRMLDIDFKNLSQFSGPVNIRGCGFAGFDTPGANSRSTSALSGKNARAYMKDCRIGSDTDQYAIHSTLMERYGLFGCTLRATDQAVRHPDSSEVTVGWGCSMNAPRFTNHRKKIRRGVYRGGKKML